MKHTPWTDGIIFNGDVFSLVKWATEKLRNSTFYGPKDEMWNGILSQMHTYVHLTHPDSTWTLWVRDMLVQKLCKKKRQRVDKLLYQIWGCTTHRSMKAQKSTIFDYYCRKSGRALSLPPLSFSYWTKVLIQNSTSNDTLNLAEGISKWQFWQQY